MPRPKKTRRCEGAIHYEVFAPVDASLDKIKQVELHRDELEALRLCDSLGLTQEEAGIRMGVSRGTVQRIVTVARKKVSTSLSAGYSIIFVDDE
ncbi:MAG: DNA-binding protein [Deltaproteobacteria bacterium]|nr:MAG: DNA-binding protein [Deltaproteobacteria bacterium]